LFTEQQPTKPAQGVSARSLAARITANVVRNSLSLEAAFQASVQPALRDASLVRALCYGVLRWHHLLQWQADELLTRPLKRGDVELAALIRIGLYQLQWLRVPDHAAVSATVSAADSLGKTNAKGLVNAVLRRFIRERKRLAQQIIKIPEAAMSHPSWMLAKVKEDWPEEWLDIINANNGPPPMWLRVNARQGTRERYLASLGAAGVTTQPVDGPSSAILLSEPQAMSTLPGFADGEVSVQDAAAQLAVGFLDLEPGQRILDACAAPGGKSAHILESHPGISELVALDRDPDRLAVMSTEFERLKLEGTVVHGDATHPTDWWDGQLFDRILLDAPCSALGVIRRHPDIKVLRRSGDIAQVLINQRALFKTLWTLLSPGGRLVYSTCTILKEENQHQIQWFLEETPTARSPTSQAWNSRQILPGEANMDGFYYACIEKSG